MAMRFWQVRKRGDEPRVGAWFASKSAAVKAAMETANAHAISTECWEVDFSESRSTKQMLLAALNGELEESDRFICFEAHYNARDAKRQEQKDRDG